MESSANEFNEAVVEALKERGVLDKLSCSVRAEILRVLRDPQPSSTALQSNKKSASEFPENFIINELIKEYLDFNGCAHTVDVLCIESSQARKRTSREDLERSIGLECGPNARQVPLLYAILAHLRKSS